LKPYFKKYKLNNKMDLYERKNADLAAKYIEKPE